jgi:hypothetical protein
MPRTAVYADANCASKRNTDTYAYSNTYDHAQRYPNSHKYCYSYDHAYCYANSHSYCYEHTQCYTLSDSYSHGQANAYGQAACNAEGTTHPAAAPDRAARIRFGRARPLATAEPVPRRRRAGRAEANCARSPEMQRKSLDSLLRRWVKKGVAPVRS